MLLYYGTQGRRPLHFVGSSLKDLRKLPEEVQDSVGSALLDAQYGDRPEHARPFGEGLPKPVMKLAIDERGDTHRTAYVDRPGAVYVLHVFKKKSKKGAATPTKERTTIRDRLGAAYRHHEATYG